MSNAPPGGPPSRRHSYDPGETVIVDTKPQGAGARDRGVITITDGPGAGRVVSLGEAMAVTLGRSADCTVCIADTSLSREHARIVHVASKFILKDAGSKNGTFLNGNPAKEALELNDGDRIRLGATTTLRFSLVDENEEKAMKQVYESTLRDGLTGLYNRRHLEHQLDAEIASALRHEKHLAVAMIDIDHFKKVNDTYGHAAGDAVLKSFAQTLTALLRPEDVVARYGGEEFTLILRETDLARAVALANRLRVAIEQTPINVGTTSIRITSSCGVATLEECETPDKASVMHLADARLYVAKQQGRNRVIASS
jgi:two-component system, cell cycle response regulator